MKKLTDELFKEYVDSVEPVEFKPLVQGSIPLHIADTAVMSMDEYLDQVLILFRHGNTIAKVQEKKGKGISDIPRKYK
jgi:hypothetical protein